MNPGYLETFFTNDGGDWSSSDSMVSNVAVTRPNITVAALIKLASLRNPTKTCIIGSG